MKSIKKSIIAVGLTAVSALALGIGVSVSGTQKVNSNGFMGSYNLTAYAEEATQAGVKQITVAEKVVDITTTATFISTDEANAYTLCLSVIDLADFGKDFATPLQIGYEIAEGVYYNGTTEGLSSYVYSSITFGDGETKLSVSDLSLGSSFENPYFIVAEVATSSVNSTVLNCIVAQKHNLEFIEGTPSTCAVAGNLAYYHCTDEGCDKYFTDSLGLNEIADLTAWKAGEGKLALEAHTEVTDEAVAPTCIEDGLTQGSHCSVCGTVIVAQQVDPAKGHTPVELPAEDASCTEGGLTAGSYCSVCNTVLKAQSTVPANGHTEVTDEAVAPTCTQTGLTQGSHCSDCGEILVAQTEVPALGHDYVNHICSRCNDLQKVDVNGVYYQLTAANEKYNDYHFVACGKAPEFNSLYSGKELILENKIDGYPVTEIGESAFANTDGNPIKSVIIPKNITYINNLAFAYNYGMENAVFLADTVNITGSFKEGEDGNNTPFYGCTTSSGATKTTMSIYYNTVIYDGSSTDLRWTRLWRFEASWLIYHRHFIGNDPSGSYNYEGGGTLYSNGWSYVNLTVNNNTGDSYDFESIAKTYVTEGIVATVYEADKICASVQADLDVLSTTEEKCLKYKASVTISKDDFGTTQIVVDVDKATTTYYLLTLSSATTADDGSAVGGITITGGDYQVYNGATYAANVTLTYDEVTGYKFAKYVSNKADVTSNPYTIIKLDTPYDVSVYYEATTVTIKVISAVAFNHNGTPVESSSTGIECVIDKDNVNLAPTATGYVFLGWAKEANESLEFTEITTQNGATYYAIWASNATIASATPTTSDTLPTSESLTVKEGTFNAWYNVSDTTFTTPITAISNSNTVLYARMQYTVTVNIYGSNSNIYINGTQKASKSGSISITHTITALEKETFSITNLATTSATTTMAVTSTTNSEKSSDKLTGYKRKTFGGDGDTRAFYLDTNDNNTKDDDVDVPNAVSSITTTVTSNLTYVIVF